MQNKHKNKNKPKFFGKKAQKKPSEDEEIQKLQAQYDSIDPRSVKLFTDFPLSWKTLKGLKDTNYKTPTDIQKESIGYALQGRDILGAAITGSGKTLAFLVPVLENLFLKKWSRLDGVGAIIISPTRELAYQIFETVKKIGKYHDFSAGLIIGGKNLKFERNRMDQCNIVICTPGRLLQHMDENPLFNANTMQVLVLDEADRCLDMGFEQTMNGIVENLPSERQTLLFSATQTKSVKDLARLSLENPVYVAPHEQQMSTPQSLQQNYVVIKLEDKITMLWSFIKNHLKQKCIVFMSSCKQVKYVFEMFCRLRPGTSLLALYGTLHQDRRVAIYEEFCRKSNVVLFATDIASRGLDFPVVNWVIQLDCPEDVTQYIHRAGRTARHNKHGESLLVLLPSEEEGMLKELQAKKIPIEQISIDPRKMFTPRAKMEAFLAQSKELKETAHRAFVSYIKSVVLMKNKEIFKVDELDLDAYAKSLGLVVTPRVRFLERLRKKQGKHVQKTTEEESNSEESSDSETDDEAGTKDDDEAVTKDDDVDFNLAHSDDSEDGEDLIKLKRRNHEVDEDLGGEDLPPLEEVRKKAANAKQLTKAALAKRVLKKRIIPNKKVVFNEEGEEVIDPKKQLQSELAKEYVSKNEAGIDLEMAKKVLQEEDKFDKARFKERVKARHKDTKKKLKNKKDEDEEGMQLDDFGSDDEDQVDLSWLPDPDKVYGPSKSSSGSEDSYSEEEQVHRPPARLYEKSKNKRKLEPVDSESLEDSDLETGALNKKAKKIASKLSVDEAERLAMELLGNTL